MSYLKTNITTLEDKTKVQTTFLSQNICISAICVAGKTAKKYVL